MFENEVWTRATTRECRCQIMFFNWHFLMKTLQLSTDWVPTCNLLPSSFVYYLLLVSHSSEIGSFCLMNCHKEILQHLRYFWNTENHIVFCFVFHFMSHLDETYFLICLSLWKILQLLSNLFKRNMMYLYIFRTISEKISSLIFTTKSTNFCTWSFGKIQVKFSRGKIMYKWIL